jgi:hypothetical protein
MHRVFVVLGHFHFRGVCVCVCVCCVCVRACVCLCTRPPARPPTYPLTHPPTHSPAHPITLLKFVSKKSSDRFGHIVAKNHFCELLWFVFQRFHVQNGVLSICFHHVLPPRLNTVLGGTDIHTMQISRSSSRFLIYPP